MNFNDGPVHAAACFPGQCDAERSFRYLEQFTIDDENEREQKMKIRRYGALQGWK